MGEVRRLPDFDRSPLIVFWEATKACKLVCKHCRAEAVDKPLPGELSGKEAKSFVESLLGFGDPPPVLIVTGGDPLMRSDIYELLEFAAGAGLRVGIAPSVTPLLTSDAIRRLDAAGVRSVSISLDGAKPETHDSIRGVSGLFRRTVEVLKELAETGFMVQVNTAVMRSNVEELADVAYLLTDLGVRVWEVFFLIRVGRGAELEDITPPEYEDVMHFLYEVSMHGITVRTVEAPFFRRVVLWRRRDRGDDPVERYRLGVLYVVLSKRLRELMGEPTQPSKAQTLSTRDGKGVIFVAYNGDIYPSGFTPYKLGNVRSESIVEVYRNNPVLKKIRAAEFRGRCGLCEFRDLCGGSRARAYATYGDVLAEDPACIYEPGVGGLSRP